LACVPASLYFSKTQPKHYGTTEGQKINNWISPSVAASNNVNCLRRTGGGDSYERAKSKTVCFFFIFINNK
jgi:hypothetical protein